MNTRPVNQTADSARVRTHATWNTRALACVLFAAATGVAGCGSVHFPRHDDDHADGASFFLDVLLDPAAGRYEDYVVYEEVSYDEYVVDEDYVDVEFGFDIPYDIFDDTFIYSDGPEFDESWEYDEWLDEGGWGWDEPYDDFDYGTDSGWQEGWWDQDWYEDDDAGYWEDDGFREGSEWQYGDGPDQWDDWWDDDGWGDD